MIKPSIFKYPLAWLLYILLRLLSALPYHLLVLLGSGLGKLLMLLLSSRKKVAQKNLQICFPDLSEEQRKFFLKKNISETGIMFTQTLKAFLGNTTKIESNAIIDGSEHIERCLDEKKGILLVAGHFTALDMGGKILCKKYPIAGMYRPHKHPVTEYIVTKSRLKYATHMFKRDELRPIIKHLKQGKILWYAPDQDYRRGQSVFVPFFNRPAATIVATHQLARLSDCEVLFFHVQRNPKPPYYTLKISEPLPDFPTKDAIIDTTRINLGIENMVKQCPEQYLWVHKRFKTTPDRVKNPYNLP